ncbi:DUF6287 domain-containing protein [Streptococcus sp. ZJ151]|uniref:DUF6287 domain-containing protein n=1 Tax=Streptococcus jiangjianxini TaxID=3161189 RepID=UPI0032EE2757
MKNKKFIAGLLVVFLVFLVAGKYTQSKSMLNSNYAYATTVKDKKTGKEYRYEVALVGDKKAKVTKTDLASGKQTVFEEVYQGKPSDGIKLAADDGASIHLMPPAVPWSEPKLEVNKPDYVQTTKKATKTSRAADNHAKPSSSAAQGSSTKTSATNSTAKKPSSETSTSVKTSQSTSTQTESSKIDIAAIAKGDLSSMSGSYQGENGKTPFTFNPDGTGKINNSDVTFIDFSQTNGVATFRAEDLPITFTVVPAGMATPSEVSGSSSSMFAKFDDDSKDRAFVSGEGINLIYLTTPSKTDAKKAAKTETDDSKVDSDKDKTVEYKVTNTNRLTHESAAKIAKSFGDWLETSAYAKDSVLVQSQFDDTNSKSTLNPHFWQLNTEDGPAIAHLYGAKSGDIAAIEKTLVDGSDADGKALDASRSEFDLTLLGNDLTSSKAEDFQSTASFRIYTLKQPQAHRFDSTSDELKNLVDDDSLSPSETSAAADYGYVPFYEKKVDHQKPSYQIVLASNGKVYYVTDYRLDDKSVRTLELETYQLAPADMQQTYQDLLDEFGEEKEEDAAEPSSSSSETSTSESSSSSTSSESETETTDGIFPPELIGTWVNTDPDGVDAKVTVDEDGTVTKYYDDGTNQETMVSKVTKIEKISDTTYRFVDYDKAEAITPNGLGGAGFEVEIGFSFDGDEFSFAQWTRAVGAEFNPEKDRYSEMLTFTKE